MPCIGVFFAFATFTACIVQDSVGWSGLLITRSLSAAIIVESISSLRFGELSMRMVSYFSRRCWIFALSLNGLTSPCVSDAGMMSRPLSWWMIASSALALSFSMSWIVVFGSIIPRWSPRFGAE